MAKLFSMNKPNCEDCGLGTVCRHPNLKFSGDGRLGILIVSTVPSSQESESGAYGSSQTYNFLDLQLEDMGYDLDKDFYYTTVLGCHTPRNRAPTTKEQQYCSARLNSLINRLDPHTIILLGSSGFDAIVKNRASGRLTGLSASDCYGDCIPDQDVGRWLCPTWSVEELMSRKVYNDGGESKPYYLRDNAVFLTWKKHLRAAIAHTEKPAIVDYKAMCRITTDVDVALDWVREALRWEYCAWDIEASGLKLYMVGHYIQCMSISNGKVSYAFPNFDDVLFQKTWKKFMLSDVKKIAHNLQYENTSQKVINGYWVNSWASDTMLSAHVLMNKKPTGLKYCTYAEFGVIGYDASADDYMKASVKDVKKYGTNAINRIKECPIDDLLQYNALDSLFTYKLFDIHRHKATEAQLECIRLYTDTAVSLSKMSYNGFSVDSSKFEETQKGIQEVLTTLENEIMAFPEVALWDKDTPFNFNSTQQLSHLIFDIVGVKPINYTEKGVASMDKESMEKMGHPLLLKILEYREWAKMHSTYIEGWRRECINGIVHSQFSLNTTDTGRGSSQNPNSQNSYKRDKKKKKLTRCIVGTRRKDARIMEYDFHGQETYMTMFYSKDPAYKRYLTEPGSDMHRQFASRAFFLEPEQVTKEYRQAAKTSVFALAYGAYYTLIAKSLWEYIQATPELKEHLAKKGYTTYEQYKDHAEALDKYFWTDMFGVHDKWRKEQWKLYNKNCYLESYTGFRLYPPMSRNATMNYAPQGTGSQCTFYVINHVLADIEKYNRNVLIIGYIHDSIIVECPLEDEAWLDERMWWYATQQIQTEWKWISIPFVLEKERSAVNGTWDNMYDCGELTGGYAEPKNEDERKL